MNLTGMRLLGALLSFLIVAFALMLLVSAGQGLDPLLLVATWIIAAGIVVGGLLATGRRREVQ